MGTSAPGHRASRAGCRSHCPAYSKLSDDRGSENTNPGVIVIDEIGRELEATPLGPSPNAALQLIATAQGNTLDKPAPEPHSDRPGRRH